MIASYAIATLVGGWLAGRIAGEKAMLFAAIVATFILAGTIATVRTIPHPSWFTITAVVSIVVAAFLAGYLASHHSGGRKIL